MKVTARKARALHRIWKGTVRKVASGEDLPLLHATADSCKLDAIQSVHQFAAKCRPPHVLMIFLDVVLSKTTEFEVFLVTTQQTTFVTLNEFHYT